MKKAKQKKSKKIEGLIRLYEQYRGLKKIADTFPKKQLPQLTLDERLESINPYYVKNQIFDYE